MEAKYGNIQVRYPDYCYKCAQMEERLQNMAYPFIHCSPAYQLYDAIY